MPDQDDRSLQSYLNPVAKRHETFQRGSTCAVDGPPRFVRPYIPGKPPSKPVEELPLMLYIPGIDGTGLAASRQFPGLVKDFDLRAMSIPGNNRTPFEALVRIVRCTQPSCC